MEEGSSVAVGGRSDRARILVGWGASGWSPTVVPLMWGIAIVLVHVGSIVVLGGVRTCGTMGIGLWQALWPVVGCGIVLMPVGVAAAYSEALFARIRSVPVQLAVAVACLGVAAAMLPEAQTGVLAFYAPAMLGLAGVGGLVGVVGRGRGYPLRWTLALLFGCALYLWTGREGAVARVVLPELPPGWFRVPMAAIFLAGVPPIELLSGRRSAE